MKRLIIMAVALSLLFAGEAAAEMPQLLSYQGVLTDGSGTAVSDGTYSITFRLYSAPAGGSSIWEETNPNVQVAKGIFNATLGTSVGLSSLAFDATYYVGISVAGGAELSPRQILTAVPYSFNAKAVMGTANEFPSSGNVGIGTIDPQSPLEVQFDNTNLGLPAIAIDNAEVAGQNVIDFKFGGSTRARIRNANGGAFFLGTLSNSNVQLVTDNVTRFTVTGAGNVGIGMTTPVDKLDVDGGVHIGNTTNTNAGTLRWTGADFEGYDGASWKSLTATGGGSLPSGTTGQTLWHNGSDWAATSSLYNNNSQIGIGTVTPGARLDVVGTSTQDIKVETSSSSGKASLVLKSTGGSLDYLDLSKHAPSAGGTTAGSIPLANLSRVTAGTMAGPLMLQVVSANPLYFVTSNLERMRLDANGNLGINTTSPGAKLHVDGNQWDLTNTEGDFKIGNASYRLKFGVSTGGGGAGTAGIRAVGGTQKLVLGGGNAEVLSVDGAGNTSIGGATSNAKLRLYRSGVDSAMVYANALSSGGRIELRDEANNEICALEPDVNGTGGFFRVRRSAGASGFYVDGNYAATNDPRVTITGSARSAHFYMDQSGDESVQLPSGSISSAEILDEPGAASFTDGGGAGVTIPVGGYATIGSRSITVPDNGYVLVIATGQSQALHANGTTSSCNFGVSADAAVLPPNQDVTFYLPSAAASGLYSIPATVHGLFSVAAAGTYTYYFIGYCVSGSYNCHDTQLTLVYLPTAYGTVAPTLAGTSADAADSGTRPGLTAAEIAAERAQSVADNDARIERELAEMKQRIEQLEREARNE